MHVPSGAVEVGTINYLPIICLGNILVFYFTAAGICSRMAAVKRLLVLHNSAEYIISFGIMEPIMVNLKIEKAGPRRGM